ncbi:MAG: hypothetical protein ACRES7_10965 [Gammaproteobacteria bacterium]
MRKVLVLGGIVLAIFVAGRHFDWPWADPATYFAHGAHIARNGGIPSDALTPEQAAQNVGRRATVCGIAANVYFAENSYGQPTFIDFGAPHPNEDFTVVIFGDDRANFKPSPESWMGHKICVSGRIKSYHGSPEIIASGPGQIQLSHN